MTREEAIAALADAETRNSRLVKQVKELEAKWTKEAYKLKDAVADAEAIRDRLKGLELLTFNAEVLAHRAEDAERRFVHSETLFREKYNAQIDSLEARLRSATEQADDLHKYKELWTRFREAHASLSRSIRGDVFRGSDWRLVESFEEAAQIEREREFQRMISQ